MSIFLCNACNRDDAPTEQTGADMDVDADSDADSDSDVDADADTFDVLPTDDTATFTVDASVSPAVSTVGIVEWSIDKDNVTEAAIEFGPDTNYGLVAPVDLKAEGFRTLLLGMKPDASYHFRILAVVDDVLFRSGDYPIETGGLPTALSPIKVNTPQPEQLSGGYTVTSNFGLSGTNDDSRGAVFILDQNGTYVWWFFVETQDTISRVRMSADGKYVLAGTLNVGDRGNGAIFKISMDGLYTEMLSIPRRHHDFTVLPDGTLTTIEFESDGMGKCDRLIEISPSGASRTVYTIRDDFEAFETLGEWCHSNAVHYRPEDDAYILSVLNQNMLIKVHRADGLLEWTLGGELSDFEGVSWHRQHGHDELDNGNILIFNNNGGIAAFTNASSIVLEMALSTVSKQSSETWRYDGESNSGTLGDVQGLWNGNILVTYSNAGVMQEVDRDKQLVQSFKWESGRGVGYADRRKSLYGPPNRF